jgi:type II secretory pathway component GspD/PulD (secretin)
MCNNFRINSEKIINKDKQKIMEIDKILKNLSNDKSINLIRPDKGNGIVIMDASDYNNKIDDILKDNNTFKLLQSDLTLANEDKLNRKLRQLKADGFITEKEYHYCRSTILCSFMFL